MDRRQPRYAILVILATVVVALLPAKSIASPAVAATNPLTLTWVDAGTKIVDVRLEKVSPRAPDGTVTADVVITNKRAVFYNISFDAREGVVVRDNYGRNIDSGSLKKLAQEINSGTAFFPMAPRSIYHLPHVVFPRGSQLRVTLSRVSKDFGLAVAILVSDLATVFAKTASGFDLGKAVNGDPFAATAVATQLLAALHNGRVDVAIFTAKLAQRDFIGALEILAAAIERTPRTFAHFFHLSASKLAAAARRIDKLLGLAELAPFVRDFVFAPDAGGFSVSQSSYSTPHPLTATPTTPPMITPSSTRTSAPPTAPPSTPTLTVAPLLPPPFSIPAQGSAQLTPTQATAAWACGGDVAIHLPNGSVDALYDTGPGSESTGVILVLPPGNTATTIDAPYGTSCTPGYPGEIGQLTDTKVREAETSGCGSGCRRVRVVTLDPQGNIADDRWLP